MSILSLSSRVARGYVGNAAATPCYHALGLDVWAVDTVALSNHPGHPQVAGRPLPPVELSALAAAVLQGPWLRGCKAVVSGYLPTVEAAAIVLETAERTLANAADCLFAVDPILGDTAEGLYVEEGLVAAYRDRLLPKASLAFPNVFELQVLTGDEIEDASDAVAAAHHLRARGTDSVVVTSVPGETLRTEPPTRTIGALAVDASGEWLVTAPLLDRAAKGAGDILAALITAEVVKGKALKEATVHAVSAVHAIMMAAGPEDLDLPLIRCRTALIDPPVMFEPKAVR